MNHENSDESIEAQQSVLKLKNQLQAAQKEIKVLEERRHTLLAENRRLKGQIKQTQEAKNKNESQQIPSEDELDKALDALEKRRQQLEEQQNREKNSYQRKMLQLKKQKEELTQRKSELEAQLVEKQNELESIHKASSRRPSAQQIKSK
ncbi:hypothetical protein GPJ56_004537 [Histomonas meleagridis]|uniref:uncharacterized protein n=1 Tax=Histomonas meleagridis TaxID=135588 RepID=UPI003559E94C|nr:hypothetical protein GPJ56_004537 [Histomonas meleagridis]KAH0797356.1 hypothetical protein GO595_009859 [Histomonas meleagridis]